MKLNYDAETDLLDIDFASAPSVDSRQVAEGLVVDFDTQGRPVGLHFQHAAESLDLTHIELGQLPLPRTT